MNKTSSPHDRNDVCFRYRDTTSGQFHTRTVTGAHFLWLIVQHVLPKHFRRARNFGFLHPNCKRLIALLHLLLKFDPSPSTRLIKPRAPIRCAYCGGLMTIVRTQIRSPISPRLSVPIPTVAAA